MSKFKISSNAMAMTEPSTGSDLSAIATTAVRDGDFYVVNGSKTFISNGHLCDLVVVLLSAAAVAESLFGWPGAALLFLKSVALRDWNVVAAILFVLACVVLIAETLGVLAERLLYKAWERT